MQECFASYVCKSDGYFRNYRVTICGSMIPTVSVMYRPVDDRFGGISHRELVSPAEAFSDEERRQILKFARAMKLDYAELDVMRGNTERRIYIVDANSTPGLVLEGVTPRQKRELLCAKADAFARMVHRTG